MFTFGGSVSDEDEKVVAECPNCGHALRENWNHCPECGERVRHLTRSKGGCFIATAAFGTPFADEVEILRVWRDTKLLSNSLGRAFVAFYYWISPSIAGLIVNSEPSKMVVRACLRPFVRYLKKRIYSFP